MAYERQTDKKIKGDSLDAFVENISKAFSLQLTARNAQDEARFSNAVLEQNLPLDDQLAYRKEQLARVSDDPEERKRVRAEIASLKDRIEQKKFGDAYLEKLIGYESGITSVDSVITWLEDQKSSATDQTIKDAIQKQLIEKQSQKFEFTKQLITNQTDFAVKDKSDEVIGKQITKVTAARNSALLSGNDTLVSTYDLQLQSLNKARAENSIENDMKNFAVSTITGYSSAVKLLDSYNGKINGAVSDVPITIGGVTYASPKEFWTYKRDTYIADASASGLFGRLSDEVDTKVKTANSRNSLTGELLADYTKEIGNLAGRPELAGYEAKIASTKQDSLQTGADLITGTIVDKYSLDYDLNKAIGNINTLKSLGVNTDNAYTKVILAGANVKKGQVDNILSAAQTALQNDPSLTPEKAIAAAIGAGAGTVKSPEQLTTTTEKKITGEAVKTATEGTGQIDPRLTVGGEKPAEAAAPSAKPSEGAQPPAQQPPAEGVKTITVNAGETLSAIAARELGSASRYQELAAFNNIADPNKIQAGAVLKIPAPKPAPGALPSATPPAPTPTPAPAPAAVVQTPAAPQKSPYQGTSVVDYLKSVGKDFSYASRSNIATQSGIKNYTGAADQNIELLKKLRGF